MLFISFFFHSLKQTTTKGTKLHRNIFKHSKNDKNRFEIFSQTEGFPKTGAAKE